MQTSLLTLAIVFICSLVAFQGVAAEKPKSKKPKPVKESKLGTTKNVHVCGSLYLAGQPSAADIEVFKKKGIKRVITLRTDGEVSWDEAALAKKHGLEFVVIPFRSPESLNDDVFAKIRKQLKESKSSPTVLHCGSAN